ncbi:MAG: exo-alpha-sialidase [Kiritimatiellae bacterium]|nr:exo-alpha-sialidase [Kiritimatiellia bacterium]
MISTSVTHMKDGTLLQLGRSAVRRTVGGKIASYSLISAWKSRDAARTWECLCPEVPDSDGENSQPFVFHEPNAIELPDGTILGLVRYHGEDGCLRQTVSEDGGRTWSAMVKTGLCGYPAHLISLCDGKLVAVYGRRQADPGYGEFAAISDDGGKTWDVENEIMLRHCHNDDLGYPSSCVLADGCILTVYYQSERVGRKPCLMATKWRVLQ